MKLIGLVGLELINVHSTYTEYLLSKSTAHLITPMSHLLFSHPNYPNPILKYLVVVASLSSPLSINFRKVADKCKGGADAYR